MNVVESDCSDAHPSKCNSAKAAKTTDTQKPALPIAIQLACMTIMFSLSTFPNLLCPNTRSFFVYTEMFIVAS